MHCMMICFFRKMFFRRRGPLLPLICQQDVHKDSPRNMQTQWMKIFFFRRTGWFSVIRKPQNGATDVTGLTKRPARDGKRTLRHGEHREVAAKTERGHEILPSSPLCRNLHIIL